MIYAWNHMLLPSRASTSFLQFDSMTDDRMKGIVSMPSRASTSFLLADGNTSYKDVYDVSMPSRASTSFLRRDVLSDMLLM